jgi:hypothetical protein
MSKREMGNWILGRVARDFGYADSNCMIYDEYMLGKYGGGRARKIWAERIGKKYQWIAMYQLAARLSDHVERKRDTWDPEPLCQPLILLEERQLDPTLPPKLSGDQRGNNAWWMPFVVDPNIDSALSDDYWVKRRDDIPNLEAFLTPTNRSGQRWQILTAYPTWGQRREDAPFEEEYRHMWIQIRGYLVKTSDATGAFSCLRGRNFFGRWMPEGGSYLYGFAGEYPWATPFNTDPLTYHGRPGRGDGLPYELMPVCEQISGEWEYDASLPHSLYINAPARIFFTLADLWWNGVDGFASNSRTVFRDPTIIERGPSSLLCDVDDLRARLDRLGLTIIWTLLGEKIILGGRHDGPSLNRTFSQVGLLSSSGSIRASKIAFFEKYDDSTGPRM